jgi:stress-induced-phosphoprotein 1
MGAEEAAAFKAQGNAAFSAKKYDEAIAAFSSAIEADPSDAVFYSNRSAAYAAKGDFQAALDDGKKCTELKPTWGKGYARLGKALFELRRMEEAQSAFEKGLEHDPTNASLKDGLDQVQKVGRAGLYLKLALMQDFWPVLEQHPLTKEWAKDDLYRGMMNTLKADEKALPELVAKDPRIATTVQMLSASVQQQVEQMQSQAAAGDTPMPNASSSKPAKEPEPEPEPPVELTEEEKAAAELREKANAAKDEGTVAYKARDFDAALSHYERAWEIDPSDITFLTNKAAVLLEQKKYDECVSTCELAIEKGRELRTDYKKIARAFDRMGNAYKAKGELKEALKAWDKSLSEDRSAAVLKKREKLERDMREAERLAFINPELSAKAREEGNALFAEQKFPEAKAKFDIAVKRNPDDPKAYLNRAAALTKLSAFPDAIKDCDKAISLDATLVKAYLRKATCQYFMKDYRRAIVTYEAGLKMEPENADFVQGIQKCNMAIAQTRAGMDEDARARALQTPEIQDILNDPVMNQILRDITDNPKAAADHWKNPLVREKLEKLMDAGVLRSA